LRARQCGEFISAESDARRPGRGVLRRLEDPDASCITLGLTTSRPGQGKGYSFQWLPSAKRAHSNVLRGATKLLILLMFFIALEDLMIEVQQWAQQSLEICLPPHFGAFVENRTLFGMGHHSALQNIRGTKRSRPRTPRQALALGTDENALSSACRGWALSFVLGMCDGRTNHMRYAILCYDS
jgi:hypothetical protein